MVRNVVERQQVACPAGAALVFIQRDFELRHGEAEQVALHVRVPILGSLALDKVVNVALARSPTVQYPLGYAVNVSWNPAGGLFPRFAGNLRIEPVGEETCILELAGNYEPPGGVLGALFDAAFGRRLAQATLHDLVARLGRSVASEYERRLRTALP